MKKPCHTLLILLLACLIMTSGCGSGGGDDKGATDGSAEKGAVDSKSTYIYGIASKGPIAVGFVVVYPLDASGNVGNKILGLPSWTRNDGSFVVDIGNYSGNVLVELKEDTGTYIDEATKETRKNPRLRAAVTRVTLSAVVMVTPYTEIAVQMALNDGGLTEANIDKANALTGTIAGGTDIINTRPANVLSQEDVASSNSDEVSYGLALATISEMSRDDLAGSVPAAISNISSDLKDNKTLDTQSEDLRNALQAFLSNQNNQSGVTDFSQTGIDEAISLASTALFDNDSSDINQVFKLLEDLYAVQDPSDVEIRAWFDSNIAEGYLHDGRIKADEAEVWTGQGGLYQGVSLSAVLLSAMDTIDTGFEKAYWIRVNFSGSKGTGSIVTSMVYDSASGKWLWFGNREWGVGLSNFLPLAEMIVEGNGQDVSYINGFDMVIWDYNRSAYDHGVRSAIITGPGLPPEGLILEHYYPQSYFSLYNSSTGYRYPLTDEIVEDIPDNAKYTISFYSESAGQISLSSPPAAVRTETKTFAKRPYLSTELNPSIFPTLGSDSHDLSLLNIGGQVAMSWTNPVDTTVNLASLSWIDSNGTAQSALEYPESNPDVAGAQVTVNLDTESKSADLTAQLYLRGEDAYGRGISLTWHYWKQAGSQEDVKTINDIFHTLEQIFSTPRSSNDELAGILEEWFNNNVAEDYLHDGKESAKEREEWTLLGSQYEGLSVTAILLEPGTGDYWGAYETGYRVMLYLSVPGGSGSILTSMIYDSAHGKWLWYGNREWGLGLSGFLPWAEKTISATDETFNTGFEVIIWDSNLAAFNQGVKSAIIQGPGLGDGIILKHYYDPAASTSEPYFSLYYPEGSGGSGFNYSLTDDQISSIIENSEYTINFYTESADQINLIENTLTPVKLLTTTIAKGPVLKSELETNPEIYFPVLTAPVSHDLTDANIGGSLDVNWVNPSLMTVNFISMGWLDLADTTNSTGMRYVSDYPQYDAGYQEGHVTLDTTSGSAAWFANLYLRGEDSFNRRFSVTWQFEDTSWSTSLNSP